MHTAILTRNILDFAERYGKRTLSDPKKDHSQARWSGAKALQFIENAISGYPVGVITVATDDTINNEILIDGYQRLATLMGHPLCVEDTGHVIMWSMDHEAWVTAVDPGPRKIPLSSLWAAVLAHGLANAYAQIVEAMGEQGSDALFEQFGRLSRVSIPTYLVENATGDELDTIRKFL